MQRLGTIIRLKPGCVEDYKRYHAAVWPEVSEQDLGVQHS